MRSLVRYAPPRGNNPATQPAPPQPQSSAKNMAASKTILIVTASHLCRNPRVVKEATALGEAGHLVTVLTVSVDDRLEHLDRALVSRLPFRRLALDLVPGTVSGRLRSILQRASTWGARRLLRHCGIETAQALGPHRLLARHTRRMAADLTILHTEIPLLCAEELASSGRRMAVDLEDWYSEDLLPEDRVGRPMRLLKTAESFALNRALYVSTTSQVMSEAMAQSYASPAPLVIRNVFPLQARCRLDRAESGEAPAFVWFSQTIGPGRGLEFFIDAWLRLRRRTALHLVGDDRRGHAARLATCIPADRRRDFHVHAAVPPAELPDLLARFDFGLAVEPAYPTNRDLTISNKLFQYMNAGLAVVATDTLGQMEVMNQTPGIGLAARIEDPGALAADLDATLSGPGRLRAMQEASRAAAERRFCWDRERQVLLEAVDRALAATPAS